MEVWVVCTVVPLGLNWRLYVLCTVGLEVLCSVASVNHLGPTSPSLLALLCLEGGVTYV